MSEPSTDRRIIESTAGTMVVGVVLGGLAAVAVGSLLRGDMMSGVLYLTMAGLILLVATRLPDRSKEAVWGTYGLIALICGIIIVRIVSP